MTIVLASASPRRRELLAMLGIENFIVQPAKGEERVDGSLPPRELVTALARQKAREVAAVRDAGDLVIGADTIVYLDGQVLGKPRDEAEARAMLARLSGREHSVYTGLCLIRNGRESARAEQTAVRFRSLEAGEIARYVACGEPMDKAGAYGIQGLGALLVEGIRGDFFNVMGLPLCLLHEMLKQQGVEIL